MPRVFFRAGGPLLFAFAVSGLLGAQYAVIELQPLDEQSVVADAPALNEAPEAWFVELSGAPVADGGDAAALRREKAAFRAAARQAGIALSERYAFDVLWNGLSVQVSPGDVSKLTRVPGVAAIYPVLPVALPDRPVDASSDPALVSAITMTGADIAQNSRGLTGAGINVAVMDTGVDYDHPDLGGCFGPGCRVQKGYDFVGDAYLGGTANIVPDPDPDDCNGHGTHVAGIVGANGGVKGVAPGVTFYAYRVFGCDGTTTSDIMIAAMERALADGADILSMSIGSPLQWPQYPTAAASDRLVNKGMVVVAAAGNNGPGGSTPLGLYASSAPGMGRKVISVASVDNSHVRQRYFTVSPDALQVGYNQATGAPAAPLTGSFDLVRTGTTTSAADACSSLPAGSLAGKVALIRRGTCTFNAKSLNAQNAGAAGVLIYNNVPGIQSITVAGSPSPTIPVVSISQAAGHALDGRIASGPVSMTWTSEFSTFPNTPNGGLTSGFSSFGLGPDLSFKPDIAAPGGLIRSTYPLEVAPYATLSGTSMATPHVSGAVALLLEALPHTPPMAVRTLLQNTARPFLWTGNPGLGFLDNVHRQGAGLLQIEDAIASSLKIEPSKLAVGESEAGPATHTLTFSNEGSADVTLALSHAPGLSTGPNTFAIGYFTGFASAAFSAPAITVPAGGTASVDVTIAANPGLAARSMYGGYIVATDAASGRAYRVPYAGLTGDYQSIQVLTPTTSNFPWLARRVGTTNTYQQQSAGATYTMTGTDTPYLAVHFEHQARIVRMEVFDAITGKAWHRISQFNYFGRSSTATSFSPLGFDGRTAAGSKVYTVPNGTYVIRLSVLKALGDESNPAHWETWTSPEFVIARP